LNQLFGIVLMANLVTLLITVVAAIKYPSWSYRLIGIVALGAFLYALHQAMTGQYHPGALLLTGLSSLLIACQVIVNWWRFRHR